MEIVKKTGWWLDSVRGLKAHVDLYKHMYRLAREVPPGERTKALGKQLGEQERMVGRSLLHVILVYPVGSGRFD